MGGGGGVRWGGNALVKKEKLVVQISLKKRKQKNIRYLQLSVFHFTNNLE